jgi:hypothetical protein
MSKVNYDAKRAQVLKQLHDARVKAAAQAKKDAEIAAKQAEREQNIVSDAKID